MLAQHYAQALHQIGDKDISQNFFDLLKEKGHQALLPSILKELRSLKEEKNRKTGAVVHISKEDDKERYMDEIAMYAQEMSFEVSDINFIEDSAVVGGFIIKTEDKEVDCSHRKKLVDLYKHLMTVNI